MQDLNVQVLEIFLEPLGLFFAEGRLQDSRPVGLQLVHQGFPVPGGAVGVDRPHHEPLGEGVPDRGPQAVDLGDLCRGGHGLGCQDREGYGCDL